MSMEEKNSALKVNNAEDIEEYLNKRMKDMENRLPISELELDKEVEYLIDQTKNYKNITNLPEACSEDNFKMHLAIMIGSSFVKMKENNWKLITDLLKSALDKYNEYMKNEGDIKTFNIESFRKQHEEAMCKAFESFRPNKTCDAGVRYEDPDEIFLQKMLQARYEELEHQVFKEKNTTFYRFQIEQREIEVIHNLGGCRMGYVGTRSGQCVLL